MPRDTVVSDTLESWDSKVSADTNVFGDTKESWAAKVSGDALQSWATLVAGDTKVSLRKTTLVDYPGKVAAALFFPGCGLRCPWCQNRELVLGIAGDRILRDAILRDVIPKDYVPLTVALTHIEKRRAVLGGVVISGGEPTGFAGLPALIRRIKALGLPVKLDTNGMNPTVLERLFSQQETSPDYIALDLKLPPERYGELSGNGEALKQSAALLRTSGIAHEYRTLALPKQSTGCKRSAGCEQPIGRTELRAEELLSMVPLVDDSDWYFRPFVPGNCLDPAWDTLEKPGTAEAALLAEKARELGKRGIAP
ncbi:hypothetical protein FACS1894124_7280 [Spirochaetia bacterium]|nr:hypothetical protein FACS1894124_7280 [Spirochaetia bacterium]